MVTEGRKKQDTYIIQMEAFLTCHVVKMSVILYTPLHYYKESKLYDRLYETKLVKIK